MNTKPELNREIATTADGMDITRGYMGPLMTPYDSVLRQRGGGDLLIYEQVLSDPEVKSTFGQRQLAVTSAEWAVDPGGTSELDKAAAEDLKLQLQAIGWDNVTTKMLYGVFYGYAVAEIIYDVDGSRLVMKKVKVRNRRRFRYSKEGDLRLLTMNQMHEGIKCEDPYFWHFATGADNDDEPYGTGLAHWLYWPVLFKRNGIKFWLIFLEKFAQPTVAGKYGPNTTADERNKLLQAVRAVATDTGIIMPEGMAIELLEASRSGTSDYKSLQEWADQVIQKVTLGQTASTQGTPGKLGKDELQGDVRNDIIKADADLICESFNLGPAVWLTERNFPGAKPPRVYRITDPPEDLGVIAERDTKIKALGFKPKLAYVQETYGDGWVENKESDPANTAVPRAEGAQFAEHGGAADIPVRMVPQLDRAIAPAVSRWTEQVRQAAERATSMLELREYVQRISADMTLDDYAAAMSEAMTAATLAGRFEVLQEIQQ